MIAKATHFIANQPSSSVHSGQLTEEEAELLEYDRTHGLADGEQPLEQITVFGLTGAGSALVILAFGWVFFKKMWFGWLQMPGWW